MQHIRYAQINHLHTDNAHHLSHFRLHRATDLPAESLKTAQEARNRAAREAIGDVSDSVRGAFFRLAGMIHDLYGARTLLGAPERVLSTELWNEGWGIHTVGV